MPRNYKKILGSRSYKNYSDENLKIAVEEVKLGKISSRQAAKTYNIPHATISYSVNAQCKNGGKTALSKEVELELIQVLKVAADWSYPLEPLDVRLLIQKYLKANNIRIAKFVDDLPGVDWFYGFMSRHKGQISMKKSQNIKRSRAEVDSGQIQEFFNQLKGSLEGVSPKNIINYDETNVTDDPGSVKVICRRSAKHADRVIDSSKTSTSVMFSGTATGVNLPPYIVYKSTHLYNTWTEHGPAGTIYNRSPSGWFDATLFEDYFIRIALPYFKQSPQSEPKIMLGDNCASHLSFNVIRACIDNNIRFVFLPPNSTHLTQPLDVAWFRPFKTKWRMVLKSWKLTHKGVVPKSSFPSLLRKTIEELGENVISNLVAGFKACGVCPFNPEAVLNRLPEATQTPKIPLAEVLINTFKESRYKSGDQSVPKRQALKIKPGQSVSTEETLELIKLKDTVKKIKKEKMSNPSTNSEPSSKKVSVKKLIKKTNVENKENSDLQKTQKRRCTRPLAPTAQKKFKTVTI